MPGPVQNLRFGAPAAATLRMTFDGDPVLARPGECVAAALLAAGRVFPGGFCFMGVCQECVVRIDGRVVESCRVMVRDGLVIERAG